MENITSNEKPPDKSNGSELDFRTRRSRNSSEDCKDPIVSFSLRSASKSLEDLPLSILDAGLLESKFSTESSDNATLNIINPAFISSMELCSSSSKCAN